MINDLNLFSEEIKKTFLLHIPHSSIIIPFKDGFVKNYKNEIIKLTDWETEKIFNIKNIDKIIFEYSRVFCDVERFADDKKEEMSKVGMGFFYTHTDDGQLLRESTNNIKQKIYENYYAPHHQKLFRLTKEKLEKYSVTRIIDCHSFSDKPFNRDLDQSLNRPDICIGTDEFHTPQYLIDYCVNFFEKFDFNVETNRPYSGSIVPIEYYKKEKKVESIMIEINRNLYIKDNKIDSKKVERLNSIIRTFFNFK